MLAGPFRDASTARAARLAVVEELRAALMRERRPGRFVAERVQAVQVRFGVLVGPWQHFQPLPPP